MTLREGNFRSVTTPRYNQASIARFRGSNGMNLVELFGPFVVLDAMIATLIAIYRRQGRNRVLEEMVAGTEAALRLNFAGP